MVGFADLQEISSEIRDNYTTGISITVALDPQIVAGIQDGPTPEYYEEYNRVNSLLDKLGHLATRHLTEQGERAEWFPATESFIDAETLSTPLPHKTAATLAGLGWIGKCALLVTREYGSAVRLATVLTDAELTDRVPVNESQCGDCTACVDACPGRAVSGQPWQAGTPREFLCNVFACRETARDFEKVREGVHDNICGICIAAYPWTKKYLEKAC